jgi:hypothetical protein
MLIKAGPCEGDRIAYLRGTQMGQDGRSASMSAPNGPAQEKCVWGAIREAQMTPPESTVWECHGTGTSLGDPIEVGAVRKVQIKMKRLEPLMIASSKSNTGHLEGSAAAMAMNKCVCVVNQIVCAPSEHLKCLNPHLDHTAFDAIFISECCPYKYPRGHCQVSSFGVGGTNGHAIFWGEGYREPVDFRKVFMKKVTESKPPVLMDGSNPDDWEYSGLPILDDDEKQFKIKLTRDPITDEEVITYEVVEPEAVEPPEFFCTTGNHNDWSEDRMLEGDVPYLYYQETEIPESGTLEFRILAEGDQEKAYAPEATTDWKTTPILGPDKELRTSWLIAGQAPGTPIRIEFFAPPKGKMAITWMLTMDE